MSNLTERDVREIAQREEMERAYIQASEKAKSRRRLGKAAFEALKSHIWELTHYERYVPAITVEADQRAREAFQQRELAQREIEVIAQ